MGQTSPTVCDPPNVARMDQTSGTMARGQLLDGNLHVSATDALDLPRQRLIYRPCLKWAKLNDNV
jgi:hypothetical protein